MPLALPLTSLYAALLAVLFFVLSVVVIRSRLRTKEMIGTSDPRLQRVSRAHGNFAEYVPIGLILLGLVEMQGAPPALLHAIGGALLFGRLAHAFALTGTGKHSLQEPAARFFGRPIGTIVTLLAIAAAAGTLLVHQIR